MKKKKKKRKREKEIKRKSFCEISVLYRSSVRCRQPRKICPRDPREYFLILMKCGACIARRQK